ncbi:MAG: 1-acyl-sn-glycerol-3-phosphate acyltransferase [SAR202 cluster bacterium]|nr:1-acyl-sn-glycerol-3-phosphate acyltransferase [SAR202 cluster bacterium]
MADITYGICNVAMRGALRLFSNWKVTGQENVPPDGPLLIVSNHMSNIDPPMIAASVSRRVNFIAKRGIFQPGIRWFLKAYGAFALNAVEEGNDIQAMLWMRQLLRQNRAIVVFPESTRNPYVGMQKAMGGVAFLAAKTQTTILPVGLTGTERLGPLWRVMFPTGDLTVNIGKPFTLPDTKGKMDADQITSMMDSVMGRIADLLPKEYHGVYSPTQGDSAEA